MIPTTVLAQSNKQPTTLPKRPHHLTLLIIAAVQRSSSCNKRCRHMTSFIIDYQQLCFCMAFSLHFTVSCFAVFSTHFSMFFFFACISALFSFIFIYTHDPSKRQRGTRNSNKNFTIYFESCKVCDASR